PPAGPGAAGSRRRIGKLTIRRANERESRNGGEPVRRETGSKGSRFEGEPGRRGSGVMFGIGAMELVVSLILALIIFGPGKLPEVGKAVGRAVREFKKATSDVLDDDHASAGGAAASSSTAAPSGAGVQSTTAAAGAPEIGRASCRESGKDG